LTIDDCQQRLRRFDRLARLLTGVETASAEQGIEWVRNLVTDLKIPRLGAYGLTLEQAKERTEKAIGDKREVRICDGGDELVFHSRDGKILYGEGFWEAVGK